MENKVKRIRNGGRPRIKIDDKKSEVISFRVDTMTKMAIDEKVKESKMAMSKFIRRALKSSEITPAECEDYFRIVDDFNSSRLLDLIAASAMVVQPWSNEELRSLKDLYRFASDVNALVKRGNASLVNAPIDVRINYVEELARLRDEFNEMKDYFMQRVTGDYKEKKL